MLSELGKNRKTTFQQEVDNLFSLVCSAVMDALSKKEEVGGSELSPPSLECI